MLLLAGGASAGAKTTATDASRIQSTQACRIRIYGRYHSDCVLRITGQVWRQHGQRRIHSSRPERCGA